MPSLGVWAVAGVWRLFSHMNEQIMTMLPLPGQSRMSFSAFCRTFGVSNRERLLLADGLQSDKNGIDPDAGYKLLQQIRR
jgi:hypothetical protein